MYRAKTVSVAIRWYLIGGNSDDILLHSNLVYRFIDGLQLFSTYQIWLLWSEVEIEIVSNFVQIWCTGVLGLKFSRWKIAICPIWLLIDLLCSNLVYYRRKSIMWEKLIRGHLCLTNTISHMFMEARLP